MKPIHNNNNTSNNNNNNDNNQLLLLLRRLLLLVIGSTETKHQSPSLYKPSHLNNPEQLETTPSNCEESLHLKPHNELKPCADLTGPPQTFTLSPHNLKQPEQPKFSRQTQANVRSILLDQPETLDNPKPKAP